MALQSPVLVNAWYQGAWWLWLLRPIEWLFRLLAAMRRGLYRAGLLNTYQSPVPVVVVGSITVGGAGKTPVVIALVQALQARGVRVGVVSRGYGASNAQWPHRVGDDSEANQCGDEPLLIYRRTGCPVMVGPRRAAAVEALVITGAVDVIVSDDGLQHYAMARDMEIVVLDASLATGNGFCLPAGPLREPRSRLRSVDYVLYRGGKDENSAVNYHPVELVNLATGETRAFNPNAFDNGVYAVAGIAHPQQFFASLRTAGFAIQPRPFADHHPYSADDFFALQDLPIIMTEKDAVKCAPFAGQQAWYLRMEAQLPAELVSKVAALAAQS